MNIHEMLMEMAQAPKAEIMLYKNEYGNTWSCSLNTNDGNGTKLQLDLSGNEPEEAISLCYAAYMKAISGGVKQLSPKLITTSARPAKPVFDPSTPPNSDDIPF